MNPSLFLVFIKKYIKAIIAQVIETFNGEEKKKSYLFKTMLREEYSPNMQFGSTEINHAIIAADVVAMDSSLPLKKRGSLGKTTGQIPKVGIKFMKRESDISKINQMIASGVAEYITVAKIFEDVPKAAEGIDVRNEIMFLQALSTGCCEVNSENNDGTSIRVQFYDNDNFIDSMSSPWGTPGSKPISDIRNLITTAENNNKTIAHLYMSKTYFNLMKNSTEAKEFVANAMNQVIVDKNFLPTPNTSNLQAAIEDEFGVTLHIINQTLTIQKQDGSLETIKPFHQANVVGTPTDVVGRLVYGTLAEETNKVNGVEYQKVGSYTLISMFSKNDPLEEYTTGQALCIPVIDGGNNIFVLQADQGGFEVTNEESDFSVIANGADVTITATQDIMETSSTADWIQTGLGDTIYVDQNTTGVVRKAKVTVLNYDGVAVEIVITQAAQE